MLPVGREGYELEEFGMRWMRETRRNQEGVQIVISRVTIEEIVLILEFDIRFRDRNQCTKRLLCHFDGLWN